MVLSVGLSAGNDQEEEIVLVVLVHGPSFKKIMKEQHIIQSYESIPTDKSHIRSHIPLFPPAAHLRLAGQCTLSGSQGGNSGTKTASYSYVVIPVSVRLVLSAVLDRDVQIL